LKKDSRPKNYQYLQILKDHLGGSLKKIFNNQFVYPRQIEIHLPADHKKSCNFNCFYCQGRLLKQPLDHWEIKALKLMNKLDKKIPFYIFGGAYSEPTLNPYMMAFLATAKDCQAYFGIHTNGSMLKSLEENQGWLTELCQIAADKQDYLSISLDAGSPQSHSQTKRLKKDFFTDIIKGIEMAVKIRGKRKKPTIRICYLLNKQNSSLKEIKNIIKIAKKIKVDSLRFSIPYALYGQEFSKVRKYKNKVEIKQNKQFENMLQSLISKSKKEKPYIFYLPPQFQDVQQMNFKQCIYPYYQITLGADGYVYKCSSAASASFPNHRLGKITDNLKKFKKMILANYSPHWNARENCWKKGARCNRMALEINKNWRDRKEND